MQQMSEREKYRYDLQGFLVVRNVLSADEVAELNRALDANADRITEDVGDKNQGSTTLVGTRRRQMMHGLLTLPAPWCEPFRKLLAPEPLRPHLNTILGRGWRLDHAPHAFISEKGAEGLLFHGEGTAAFDGPAFFTRTPTLMRSGMVVVAWALSDVEERDGGFACIPGSHKAGFPTPPEVYKWEGEHDLFCNPSLQAGDVLVFNEALTHGTLPWRSERQRRVLLYRYSPYWVNYHSVLGRWEPPEWADELDEAQRAVLEPPYRYRRPVLADDGRVAVVPVVSDFIEPS